MKIITAILTSAVMLLCCYGAAFADNINLKEGMWQLTTTMEIPGMPHKMPGGTFTQCLTKENLTPPVNKDKGCQITNQTVNNNTLNYTMVCNHDGETTSGQGSFSYNNDTMSGRMEITANGMHIITTYSGKWIGPCQ